MVKFNQLWDAAPKTSNHTEYRKLKPQLVQECLQAAKREVANNQVHADLITTQKERVFSAVKAHFGVEKKTIVDILLKKTKDIVIKCHQDWIQCRFLRSETIIAEAKEEDSVAELRKELLSRIQRLSECMALLHNVPLPTTQEFDSTSSANHGVGSPPKDEDGESSSDDNESAW